MKRFINRDWTRTVHDDFVLNVEPLMTATTETIPIYDDVRELEDIGNHAPSQSDKGRWVIVGWQVQSKFE